MALERDVSCSRSPAALAIDGARSQGKGRQCAADFRPGGRVETAVKGIPKTQLNRFRAQILPTWLCESRRMDQDYGGARMSRAFLRSTRFCAMTQLLAAAGCASGGFSIHMKFATRSRPLLRWLDTSRNGIGRSMSAFEVRVGFALREARRSAASTETSLRLSSRIISKSFRHGLRAMSNRVSKRLFCDRVLFGFVAFVFDGDKKSIGITTRSVLNMKASDMPSRPRREALGGTH